MIGQIFENTVVIFSGCWCFSWLRCLKLPHTHHFPGVGFGTKSWGEDDGDFEGLIIPAFKMSLTPVLLLYIFFGEPSPVSMTCFTFSWNIGASGILGGGNTVLLVGYGIYLPLGSESELWFVFFAYNSAIFHRQVFYYCGPKWDYNGIGNVDLREGQ